MDVVETLKNLSESDKTRLIVELLFRDTNNQNDPNIPLNNIQRFLVDKSPEKNSPSPKKKQKTLDEWLIKRNDTSKRLPDQHSSHQATKSRLDKVSDSERNSEEIHTGDLTPKNSENCNENSIIPITSGFVEESSTNNDLTPCVSKEAEANNLFSYKCASRSKRKVSQPSPGLDQKRTSKRVKSTCDKQDYLLINDSEGIESDKLSNPNCTSENENIMVKKNIIENNLTTKKKTYNLRTKAKNSKSVQVDKANNNKSEIDLTDMNIKKINHRSNDTLLDSKYEAFCKLDQICKEMNINVLEILRDKNVKSVLSDPKMLSNDAIVFIGSLQLNNGKTSPIVHLAESKKKLLKHLVSMQEKLSNHKPT